jgi:hypothetical protein
LPQSQESPTGGVQYFTAANARTSTFPLIFGNLTHVPARALRNDTTALSASQRVAILDEIRNCWTYDAGAPDVDQMQVMSQITTDQNGTAQAVRVTGDDRARLGDPQFRAFAARAKNAVLDPRCSASLPLPATMLGKNNVLTRRFSP